MLNGSLGPTNQTSATVYAAGQERNITIIKLPFSPTYNENGTVYYTYYIINSGNLGLKITDVTDEVVGSLIPFKNIILPSNSYTYMNNVPYLTNQTQFDAGKITNTVIVTSQLLNGTKGQSNSTSATVYAAGQNPNITITKVSSSPTYNENGMFTTPTL